MTDLRDVWDDVAGRLADSRHVLVLSDYDGTLVPIVDRPELAVLTAPARRVLERLRDSPRVVLGIVSGRALADLTGRVGLPGLWYVGNHGYEIRSPEGEEVLFYEPEELRAMEAVREDLARRTAHLPGTLLEPKGPVLALHFRQVEPSRVLEVERAFFDVVARHRERLMVARGKCVLEARLRAPCTKGSAVRFIRKKFPVGTLTLYFGDDTTDQDAFRELRNVGVTVAVGAAGPALAHYTLPAPGDVAEILDRLSGALRKKDRPGGRRSRR